MHTSGRQTLSALTATALVSATLIAGNSAQAALPQTELDALTAIYNGLNGDNWTDNTGWNTDTDPCTDWAHVFCNAEGTNVVKLAMYDINASGFISTAIADLTELEELNLALNRLSDSTLPKEIGNLSKLERLYVHDTYVSGTIPDELGQLTNLVSLYLDDNVFLEGGIPESFGNLSKLEELRLYNNNLSGAIPDSLSGLTALSDLRLYNNKFTGEIPGFVAELPNLSFINLDWNALHSTDATLNSFIDSRLVAATGSSYLDTQTLDAQVTGADLGETSIRLRWNTANTSPSTAGGYRVYITENAEGPFTWLKDAPVKSSSSTYIDNLTAETTYYFKVTSYTNDVDIISDKGELESSGVLYDAFEITTLAAGSGNADVDTTADQKEEEQPVPVDPTEADTGTDTGSGGDSDSGGSSGGGAPLAVLFAMLAGLIRRKIRA